jgi:hypothetical protein
MHSSLEKEEWKENRLGLSNLFPIRGPDLVICRCLQRAKSITLSLLPVSDINRITQGYGLPGRKTGDVFRFETVISTQQTLSRD